MAWTKYQIFLAFLMVVTGSINTLATKWADDSESQGRDGGKPRKFNHPFLQACGMFFGEFLCFLAYKAMYFYYQKKDYTADQLPDSIKGNTNFNPLIFLPPALCDMVATSLMYIGLNLTNSSSFQMLRGALIVFTGLLTVTFLRKKLKVFQWIGIFIILGGLIIVGLNDFISNDSDSNNSHNSTNLTYYNYDLDVPTTTSEPEKSDSHSVTQIVTGDLLIIFAQIITATQMIVEEKFVSGSNVSPMQAVGWEGIFGFSTLSLLLIPMYFIKIDSDIFPKPDHRIEDVIDGFYQIANNWQVPAGLSGTIFSIAFFNFAGVSVTKQLSATTRTVLDSIRTFVIWVISLLTLVEKFSFIKLGGFIVLIIGMCVYNDVVIRPTISKVMNRSSRSEHLVNDVEDISHENEIMS